MFDVCIVCAVDEEADAVVHEFSDRCENIQFQRAFSRKNEYAYRHATLKNNEGEFLTVQVICMPFPGPIETVLSVRSLLEEFHPRFVAMTGFCAGYREKVALGDLVAASYAFHYEEGKVEATEEGQDKLHPEWRTHGPAKKIVQYLHTFTGWEPPLMEMKQRHLGRKLLSTDRPKCLIVPIASGMAVQANNPFPHLLEHNRKVLFLDQEVAAFYQTLCESPDTYFLAVKGVCDSADPQKNDDYHEYAAHASAVYLLTFIQEYVTEQSMPRREVSPVQASAFQEQLPTQKPKKPDGFPPLWNVPYRHSAFFTGRDRLVERLFANFTSESGAVPIQALTGLGGLGKTQTAVQYAYRYRKQYQTVLWIKAETEEELLANFKTIAELLNRPEVHLKQRASLLDSMQEWFRNTTDWLLILDNADDPTMVEPFLPKFASGHLLLTSRAIAQGELAQPLALNPLGPDDGALCILRRANLIPWTGQLSAASPASVKAAQELSQLMDGLPLALEQAGAYIETTGRSVSGYLDLYRHYRSEIQRHPHGIVPNYREPVAFAWNIAREMVKQENGAALELLHLCAYLSPNAIPYKLFTNGARFLGSTLKPVASDDLALDRAIRLLRKHSLIKNEVDHETDISRLIIHPVLQDVLKDDMDQRTQRLWAERAVHLVGHALPPVVDKQTIQAHVRSCIPLIERWKMSFREADLIRQYVAAEHE